MKTPSLKLHAIIMKKPYFKSKKESLNYVRKHFTNIHVPGFVRETESSYRVRIVPKTKFIKTGFVSKPITQNITFVYGKLM